MNLKTILIAALFFITSCKSQPAIPTVTATSPPAKTLLPTVTATLVPTETPSPIPTPSDVFGSIPLNSVQAFTIEPVAQAIFDQTLQGYVASGSVQEYRVDRIAVFPSGQGTLIAEISYSLRTPSDPWLEDGGLPAADGWITGRCSRFDLIVTEEEHQLKNKRLCS